MPARVAWNTYRVSGDVAYIEMRDGYEAITDAEDLERVRRINWTARVRERPGKHTPVYVQQVGYAGNTLHRFIMDAPAGQIIDHVDHNGLDNRKANLRFATNSQNMQNRTGPNRNNKTGHRGVSVFQSRGGRQKQYYMVRVWLPADHLSGKKSVVEYFPFDDDGLLRAAARAQELRALHMTHAG